MFEIALIAGVFIALVFRNAMALILSFAFGLPLFVIAYFLAGNRFTFAAVLDLAGAFVIFSGSAALTMAVFVLGPIAFRRLQQRVSRSLTVERLQPIERKGGEI